MPCDTGGVRFKPYTNTGNTVTNLSLKKIKPWVLHYLIEVKKLLSIQTQSVRTRKRGGTAAHE